MKKQLYRHLKSQIRALRRQLNEELTASKQRAVIDDNIISELRQQLHAATIKKNTDVDALISRLHSSAEQLAMQVRLDLEKEEGHHHSSQR